LRLWRDDDDDDDDDDDYAIRDVVYVERSIASGS
jgi:hypothetical protein